MAIGVPSLARSSGGQIRPFDARRDLEAVADLIERSFGEALDRDGRRYIAQMRQAARNPAISSYWGVTSDLAGFVWEQQGRVLGNVSLIPYRVEGQRRYLIANVAVEAEHRRHGIARNLTQAALDYTRQRHIQRVWLHVRDDNQAAIALYQSLGFVERARRTSWRSSREYPRTNPPEETRILPRKPGHWQSQIAWLNRSYPADFKWHLPLQFSALRPGLIGAFQRLFNPYALQQWSVEYQQRLEGVLVWQHLVQNTSVLYLAAPEDGSREAIQSLLLYARQKLPAQRSLLLEYPAGQYAQQIEHAGFHIHQTLIWMEMPLA